MIEIINPKRFFHPVDGSYNFTKIVSAVREYVEQDLKRSVDSVTNMGVEVKSTGKLNFQVIYHLSFSDEFEAIKIIDVEVSFLPQSNYTKE